MLTIIIKPDKEVGWHQHHREVDSHCCLKIELFEECCGVSDQKKEDGGKVGGQQFIGNSSLELYLHFYTLESWDH